MFRGLGFRGFRFRVWGSGHWVRGHGSMGDLSCATAGLKLVSFGG